MDKLVMKFGGTSIASGRKIRRVAELVREHRVGETLVVASATASVTDMLIKMSNKVAAGASEEEIKRFTGDLREEHLAMIKETISTDQEAAIIEIGRLCAELEKVLVGVSYVGELTPLSLDYILSFGERLSAPIIAGALNSTGIKSMWLTGFEAGIITDSNFGNAKVIWDLTTKKAKKVLKPKMEACIPVVTGFIAGDKKGRTTTLGRGGSDYSAALLGAALDVDEIWIWTDVDGIMSTDPKLVKEARVIDVMSYAEAAELAYFGGRVLHPKTIEPAMEAGIPVRVRNTFKPENPGTLIVKRQKEIADIVKAVSVMKNVALLTIEGIGMIGVPGVAARVFTALAKERVNIIMISQGSSEVNISVVVEKSDMDKATKTISQEFAGRNIIKDVRCEKDVAVIAVIGAGMRGAKGVAARVFTAVAKAGSNIIMISQGSSEANISFVVDLRDAKGAAKGLHDEFVLKERKYAVSN
ncbi:MAG: aspartate kinase [Candidatus Hydrothermarchaeales archaeon]